MTQVSSKVSTPEIRTRDIAPRSFPVTSMANRAGRSELLIPAGKERNALARIRRSWVRNL